MREWLDDPGPSEPGGAGGCFWTLVLGGTVVWIAVAVWLLNR